MRWIEILIVLLVSGTVATASACPFEQALYSQPGGWQLRFQPVPRGSPTNQSASFVLTLNSGADLVGRISWPNGYSTPLWSAEGPCRPDGTELCRFTDQESNTAYVLTETGIQHMPHAMDGPPARQLLLPRLASNLWYSWYRGTEFEGQPGDVFTFSGCAS